MTVGKLIQDLQQWIKDGLTKESDKIYVTTDPLSYDTSEIFEATFHGSNSPEYDEKDPAKQCIIIGCLKRIPNYSNKNSNEKYKQYGTGYDIIDYDCNMNEDEIELLILKDKYKHIEKNIKYLEDKIFKKKHPDKFVQTEMEF